MAYTAGHDLLFRHREDLAAVLAALITADADSAQIIAKRAKVNPQTVLNIEAGTLEWVDEPTAAAIVDALASYDTKSLSGVARATADAGADVAATTNAAGVALDGTGSVGLGTLTYAWTQTAGTAVTLSDDTVAAPTFTAPASPETLTFQLVVTDGATGAASRPDTVDVVVSAP